MPPKKAKSAKPTKDAEKGKKDKKKPAEIPPKVVVDEWVNELWENVDRTILKKYWDSKMVHFIVQCAHLALLKVLNLEFYQHNYYPNFKEKDEPPLPSPADSWAINQMAVLPKIDEDDELVTLEISRSLSEEDDVSEIEPEEEEAGSEPAGSTRSEDSTFSNIVQGRIREIEHCHFAEQQPIIRTESSKMFQPVDKPSSRKVVKNLQSKLSKKSNAKTPVWDILQPVRIMAKSVIPTPSSVSTSQPRPKRKSEM